MHIKNSLHRALCAVLLGITLAAVTPVPMGIAQDFDDEDSEVTPNNNLVVPQEPLQLLQPLDDSTTELQPSPGIQIFFDYFNLSWPWLVGTSAGIAVFWSLVGGIQVILSGGDPGKRQTGIDRILWSLAGLVILGLAGIILRTLNPLFYQ